MRNKIAQAVVAGTILVASLVAYAPGSGAAARNESLPQAAIRTAAQSSLRFDLTAEIQTAGSFPYVLDAHGALGRHTSSVAMKVANVRAPDGRVLVGPSAAERTDGTFLYVRSSVTQALAAGMWVRERLSALHASSPELRILQELSPRQLVLLLGRAQDLTRSDGGRVYHGRLPYTDTRVASTLAGLEAGTQYRHLRLTAWVSPEGRVLMLLLSGRTADRTSTFLLTLTLAGFDRPVSVAPPRQGSFVDFNLSRLAS